LVWSKLSNPASNNNDGNMSMLGRRMQNGAILGVVSAENNNQRRLQ